MTRVKYKVNEDGSHTSKPLPNGRGTVSVRISPEVAQQLFRVVVLDGEGNLVNEFTAKSLALSKLKAKKLLKILGVKFLDEVRGENRIAPRPGAVLATATGGTGATLQWRTLTTDPTQVAATNITLATPNAPDEE